MDVRQSRTLYDDNYVSCQLKMLISLFYVIVNYYPVIILICSDSFTVEVSKAIFYSE